MRTMLMTCAALLVALPVDGMAQRRTGAPGGQGRVERGVLAGVEDALRQRERLSLTEDQVRQLEELRGAEVENDARRASEMRDLMSQARAGLLEDAAVRERLSAARDAERPVVAQARERFDGILTEEQRGLLRSGARVRQGRRADVPRAGLRRDAPGRGGMRQFAPAPRSRAWGGAVRERWYAPRRDVRRR